MEDKLLPCPFCGGEAEFNKIDFGFYVICPECMCSTQTYSTDDDAISTWNNRPSHWNTGTPTEEGWYLFSYKYLDTIRYGTDCFLDGKWVFIPALDEKMLAWQKIEPFKEIEDVLPYEQG